MDYLIETNSLWLSNDMFIYSGFAYPNQRHSYYFHQICIPNEQKINLRGLNNSWQSYKIAFIPSGMIHETDKLNKFTLISFDPIIFGRFFYLYKEVNLKNPAVEISDFFDQREIDDLLKMIQNNDSQIKIKIKEILSRILSKYDTQKIDSRIDYSIMKLNTSFENFTLKDISKELNLSTSRFRHLFKEQTGTSLSSYKLWLKLIKSILHLGGVKNLIDSTYEGGFADQSHFSRIFKKTFGMSPSECLKNKNLKVVIFS